MKIRWIVTAVTAIGITASVPALADVKHHGKRYTAQPTCVDQPVQFSWGDWFFGSRPAPKWNGCSPPVYVNGEFVGQDPDPNIRNALRRNPDQGYRNNAP